jgi:beta/gamma crystallin
MDKKAAECKLSLLVILLSIALSLSGSLVYGQYHNNEESGPGVFLYKHANFRGSRIFIPAGSNIRNLHQEGWNDKISSIELVDGARAVVFEHRNYQGAWVKIKRDVIDLVEYFSGIEGNWNDKISSIKVLHGNRRYNEYDDGYDDDYHDEEVYCIFYKHANRRGRSFEGRLGRHKKVKRKWNDEISSIWIKGGYEVVLYEHGKFRGRRLVLKGKGRIGSTFNLVSFQFNDLMSSYILEQRRRSRFNKRRR